MVHLIVVIMGIALMGYLLVSGISYINPGAYESKEKFERWSVLNLNLTIAWTRYHDFHNRNPSSVADLKSMLSATAPIPDSMVLTQLPTDFRGWCFEGVVTKAGVDSMKALASRYPDQYGLSSVCGKIGGIDPMWRSPVSENEYPAPVAITYRLSQ